VSKLRTFLQEKFGESAEVVVSKLASGEANEEEIYEVVDFLGDLVHNEGTLEETAYYFSNGEDWVPIDIWQYAGVFWVTAPELEEVGYFESREDAETAAWMMDHGDTKTTLDPWEDPRM
jgi:hypothetical protein